MQENLYYQESGEINISKFIIFALLAGLLTLLLGYAYSILVIFIPIIYINFLITIGLGLILGFMARLMVRLTHNRSKKSQYGLAVGLGLMANYAQWTTYVVFAINGEIPAPSLFLSNLSWIFNPGEFFMVVGEIYEYGMFEIFGVPINGFVLLFIWILEIFIITVLPIVAVRKTHIYPYSEILGKWYTKYTLTDEFENIAAVSKFVEELRDHPLTAIQSLSFGMGFRHSKVHLFYEKDEDRQYLTIENIYYEGRGEGKKRITNVINNFAVKTKMAEVLLSSFENKKERIEIL